MSKPLDGRSILVTRSANDAAELTRRLEALGAQVTQVPCIAVRPIIPASAALRAAIDALPGTAWVAFASRYGVQFFDQALQAAAVALPPTVRLAAVGPSTAELVASTWRPVDLLPQEATGTALAHALTGVADPAAGPILLPAAAAGRPELADILRRAAFHVTSVPVYETRIAHPDDGPVHLPGRVDYVLFTSPSTVEGFLARSAIPAGAQVITIGPTTTHAARARGLEVQREAAQHTLDGLVDILR